MANEVSSATGYAGVVSVSVAEMPVLRTQRRPPGFDRRTRPVSAGSGELSTSSSCGSRPVSLRSETVFARAQGPCW